MEHMHDVEDRVVRGPLLFSGWNGGGSKRGSELFLLYHCM